MEILIGFGFIFFIVFMFIITYLLNANTPAPDIKVDISACGGCRSYTCGHHPSRKGGQK